MDLNSSGRTNNPSTSSPQSYEVPRTNEGSVVDHASTISVTASGHQISQLSGPHAARAEMIQHAREDLAAIQQETGIVITVVTCSRTSGG